VGRFRVISSGKHQVVAVLEQLLSQWRDSPPADWRNQEIPRYLKAMAAWLRVYDHKLTG